MFKKGNRHQPELTLIDPRVTRPEPKRSGPEQTLTEGGHKQWRQHDALSLSLINQ